MTWKTFRNTDRYRLPTAIQVKGLASFKRRFNLLILHKTIAVPSQVYDSCYPFVWCVCAFYFASWLGTFRLEFSSEFNIFLWFYLLHIDIVKYEINYVNIETELKSFILCRAAYTLRYRYENKSDYLYIVLLLVFSPPKDSFTQTLEKNRKNLTIDRKYNG